MSILAEIARPFWLDGLNQISGPQPKGLGGLICDENYQIYSQITPTSFILSFTDMDDLLKAFAGDINRIGAASFESAIAIRKSDALPKSTAWLVIQSYYSAFFAAHAILRLLGESCTAIEREQVSSLMRIGALFGVAPSSPISGGIYHLICDTKAKTMSGSFLQGSSHEVFWRVFHERISRLSTEALSVTTESLVNRQIASSKLSELSSNLCFQSAPRGRWLSTFRNAVNYGQKHSTWHPYSGHRKYFEQLFLKSKEWNDDPLDLDLSSHDDKDLRRFQVTCNFIIATFRSLSMDMANRCTTGKSFHNFGALACLNVARQ